MHGLQGEVVKGWGSEGLLHHSCEDRVTAGCVWSLSVLSRIEHAALAGIPPAAGGEAISPALGRFWELLVCWLSAPVSLTEDLHAGVVVLQKDKHHAPVAHADRLHLSPIGTGEGPHVVALSLKILTAPSGCLLSGSGALGH